MFVLISVIVWQQYVKYDTFDNNNKHKNTIVAVYFKIKSKRASTEYLKWAKNFLKLKNPIVLYTSEDNYDNFIELRGNLPIKIIIQEFNDIYMWKKYKEKWIDHYEMDPQNFHSPELYAIWANKSIWLEDAIKNNYFNTEYFQYTDLGSFRQDDLSECVINNYPLIDHYESNKIIISLLEDFKKDDYIIENNIIGNFLYSTRVDGSSFGGSKSACLKYRVEYEKMLNIYFDNNRFAGKDESVMSSLVLAQPNFFILIKAPHWFYLQHILSKTDVNKNIFNVHNNTPSISDFDWKYYINNNPDIPNDIKNEEKALEHYKKYGINKNYKINPIIFDNSNNKKVYLSIISQFKNEGMIMDVWIKHHIWQGVEHFYLIDNNSDDNSVEILKPYIDDGIVTLYQLPGKYKQNIHVPYVYGKEKLPEKTKWVIYIDTDEYFYCMKGNIRDNLKNYENYSGIHAYWKDFGSNGLTTQPKDPRTAFTTRRPNYNKEGKCIIQTDYITEYDFDYHPHWFSKIDKNILTLPEIFRLNHYRIMSLEYFQKVKMTRGSPTFKNQDTNFRTIDYFKKYDEGNTFIDLDLRNLVIENSEEYE